MGCEPITLPGVSGWICSRGRRARPRCRCGAVAPYLCDGPSPTRRSGTCDAPICGACATVQGPDRHLCAECATTATSSPPESVEAPTTTATAKPAAPLYALSIYPEWAWAVAHLRAPVLVRPEYPEIEPPFWLAIHAGPRFGGRSDLPVYRPGVLRPAVAAARGAGWTSAPVEVYRDGRAVGGHVLTSPEGRVVPLPPVGPRPVTRAFVAVVQVVDALRPVLPQPWWPAHEIGWLLYEHTPLPEPISCPPQIGLRRVEGELLDRVREQWRTARAV